MKWNKNTTNMSAHQLSDEWFNQRLGRFTASQAGKLMGIKGIGDTGKTLALEKACEIVFGRDENWNVETWDMKRGKEQEELAFNLFQSIMARKFIKVEKASFFPLGDDSGASPDGLVGNDSIVEIKCPKPEKFFKIIRDGIKALDSDWIIQVQHQMKCTNSKKCYFFVYCIWNEKELHHTIEIEFDKETSESIIERIGYAVKERDKYVKDLLENCQFKDLITAHI